MSRSPTAGTLASFGKRAALIGLVTVTSAFGAYILWKVRLGLLVAFAAVLFALLLDGLAAYIGRYTRLRRRWSVLLALLLIGGVIIGGISAGGARVAEQAPQLSHTLQTEIGHIQDRLHAEGINPTAMLGDSSGKSFSLGQQLYNHISQFIAVPLGIVAELIVIVVAGIYFAGRPRFYLSCAVCIFPPDKRPRIYKVASEVGNGLRRWLAGRFLAMLVVGILISAGLALIGVRLAFLLGFIAGLLTFLPYLGAVISAVPAILVALLHGFLPATYVVGLFVFAHVLEGYVLIPWIQERQVSMAPAYLILAQLLGGLLAGGLGVLLATPLTVSITIVVQMLYLQDVLGEQVHILGERD